jgi:P-aminobenzoate N-oxygenase AurF
MIGKEITPMALLHSVVSGVGVDGNAVPAAKVDRLLRAAQRQHHDPLKEIDWSVPIDDSAGHLPAEHLPLYGTGVWEAMSESDRRRYSRHECASLFATGIWLENILMRVVMRYLYSLGPDHPSHRYLLIETADECRHSAMFCEYVRHAGTPPYRPSARLRAEGELFLRTQGLVSCFIGILAAEELTDASNRATMHCHDLHPLARQIAQIHVAEESRHRSFAKLFIREQWPGLPKLQKALTAAAAPMIAFTIAESMLNPLVYRTLAIPGGYRLAQSNPRYWKRVAADLGPFTALLGEVGVINALTRPAWRALGLIADRPGGDTGAQPAKVTL